MTRTFLFGTNGKHLYNFIQETTNDDRTFEGIIEELKERLTVGNGSMAGIKL